MVTLRMVKEARGRLGTLVRRTPLFASDTFTHLADSRVFLKAENLQRTGSFKLRGALNKLSQLTIDQQSRGVIAASAGNHAQGVALAAAHLGVPATVVMPVNASLAKLEATVEYGATVIQHGTSFDDARAYAESFAAEQGLTVIPTFDDEAIIAGQGTVGLELFEDLPEAEMVIVPVGGGGLLAGIATALRALQPTITIIGVQSSAAPAMAMSYRSGRRMTVSPKPTIADGIAVGQPGRLPLAIIRKLVDDVVTVDDEAISHAIMLLLERSKLLVEAAGAVGVAALLAGSIETKGKTTVAVLSGGNLDVMLLARIVEHGLTTAGRYFAMRVTVPDKPGQLAQILALLASKKVNVLDVQHHRSGFPIPMGDVEIDLTLEVQNREHGEDVRALLRERGYREGVVSTRRQAHTEPGDTALPQVMVYNYTHTENGSGAEKTR